MHVLFVWTLGDTVFLIILMGLLGFIAIILMAMLYEKIRRRIARFLSGSWWCGK